MINFNDNHIVGNYIKQLLKEFNLPHYNNGNWANNIPNYTYNQKIRNITKNLKINSNSYDAYTHEYLGEYLRFYRDYNKIDLMPLYNCFSDNLCAKLNYKTTKKIIIEEQEIEKEIYNFNTSDKNYKIYYFPVKLNKEYTIAIDSVGKVEVCCGIYSKYQINDTNITVPEKEKNDDFKATILGAKLFTKIDNTSEVNDIYQLNIPLLTYTNYNFMNFQQPIVYDKLLEKNIVYTKELDDIDPVTNKKKKITVINQSAINILKKYEDNLKMFIKLDIANESSITVLEGNYLGYNDCAFTIINTDNTNDAFSHFKKIQNKLEFNFKEINKLENANIPFITNLDLLKFNTGTSYPFADRLIEYLTNNAITSQEDITDNIKRIQKVMMSNHIDFLYNGIWEDKIRYYIYANMQEDRNNTFKTNHDILGYIDKDSEYLYKSKKNDITIAQADIYDTMYLSLKNKKGGK